jgi:hypothetical protein
MERAWDDPTMIEIVADEGKLPYVNVKNLNDGDEIFAAAGLCDELASVCGVSVMSIAWRVLRLCWKLVIARKIFGEGKKLDIEPADPAQIIKLQVIGGDR